MIPGSANPLLLASAAAGGVQIERSLRFNSSDSAYCGRTFSTPTTQGTFTFAAWVKRAALGTTQHLFGVSTNHSFGFTSGNALNLTFAGSSALTTTALFRDPSAWYHIVWTQSGTSHTLYVNNVSVGTATATSSVFNTAVAHQIGAANTANYFDGYLADIHFIDGQALTPSSFTEVSATTGQLIPKAYTGTFGTNGFWLNFSDNSAATAATLGADTSGNGNNWTPNNLSTTTGGPTSVAAASGALPVFNTTDTYGAVKGTGTRTDTNSASIVLALPMDGTNGGTSFGDQSAVIKGSGSAKTVTVIGNTNTSTAQSKFYGSSGYFDGTGDYLTIPAQTDFAFGTGDFTVECWVYQVARSPYQTHLAGSQTYGVAGDWLFVINAAGTLAFQIGNSSAGSYTSTSTVPLNVWTHVSLSRQSGTVRGFINGADAGGSLTYSTSIASVIVFSTGSDSGGNANSSLNGYLQDVRVYKGVAKYTSSFNPPSSTANATVAAGNDSLVDTPTSISATDTGVGGEVRGNYCTWNPLDANSSLTLSNGNLDASNTGSTHRNVRATFAYPATGKWYYEVTITGGNAQQGPGIAAANKTLTDQSTGTYVIYTENGNFEKNGVQTGGQASYTTGDVIGIAYNCDTNSLTFYKNNTSQGSVTPSTGSQYFPYSMTYNTTFNVNFGQRAFAYTAPSGFKALCDTNIPEGTITTSGTFTGNASADGPFVYLNGVPTAMTINSNAVTFATDADKLSNGFKLRTSSGSYNTAGSNSYSITTTGAKFKYARAQSNP